MTLKHLSSRYLDRYYEVVDDGRAIARMMRESDIPSEMKTTIVTMGAD